TTEGSTCLANWLKLLESSTGFGITRGVASGAAELSRAAFTPEFTRVPITIPIDRVKSITVSESNFCARILSKKLIGLSCSSRTSQPDFDTSCCYLSILLRCAQRPRGFILPGMSKTLGDTL